MLLKASSPTTTTTTLLNLYGLTIKNIRQVSHLWLTPVILATQESRDQDDLSSKPGQANSLRPFLKNTHHKKGLVAQG
jgi:hypothetical protein